MRRIISPPPFEIILPLNFDDFFSFLNWREKKVFGFFFLEYWCLQFTIFGLLWIYYVIKPIDRVIQFFFLLSSTPCRKWSTTSTHHPVNRKVENDRLNVINLYRMVASRGTSRLVTPHVINFWTQIVTWAPKNKFVRISWNFVRIYEIPK